MTTGSLYFSNSCERFSFSLQTCDKGPLLTIVTTTEPESEHERWTVAQLSGQEVNQLQQFLKGFLDEHNN
jgi:hypothetical protein